jgi:hypothetical protein
VLRCSGPQREKINNSSAPNINDIIKVFPRASIQTIQGYPTFRQLRENQQLLNINAIYVDSYLNGGNLDHVGIIVYPV